MKLLLDHTQRIQLGVLLGNLEVRGGQPTTIAELKAAWELMDKFALDAEERERISLVVQVVDGLEAFRWDVTKSLAPREFLLEEAQARQLARAIKACPMFTPLQARRWLEPLLREKIGRASCRERVCLYV